MANENGGWGEPGFHYYYVDAVLADIVRSQLSNSSTRQFQFVPKGQRAMKTAAIAGEWLGSHDKLNIAGIYIVGHGGPGSITVGEELKSHNIAPLGGWLRSFLAPSARVRVLGCAAAADDFDYYDGWEIGQMNKDPNKRKGYNLLYALADAARRITEGALNGQSNTPLGLKCGCRRVYPSGFDEHFYGRNMRDPWE